MTSAVQAPPIAGSRVGSRPPPAPVRQNGWVNGRGDETDGIREKVRLSFSLSLSHRLPSLSFCRLFLRMFASFGCLASHVPIKVRVWSIFWGERFCDVDGKGNSYSVNLVLR